MAFDRVPTILNDPDLNALYKEAVKVKRNKRGAEFAMGEAKAGRGKDVPLHLRQKAMNFYGLNNGPGGPQSSIPMRQAQGQLTWEPVKQGNWKQGDNNPSFNRNEVSAAMGVSDSKGKQTKWSALMRSEPLQMAQKSPAEQSLWDRISKNYKTVADSQARAESMKAGRENIKFVKSTDKYGNEVENQMGFNLNTGRFENVNPPAHRLPYDPNGPNASDAREKLVKTAITLKDQLPEEMLKDWLSQDKELTKMFFEARERNFAEKKPMFTIGSKLKDKNAAMGKAMMGQNRLSWLGGM